MNFITKLLLANCLYLSLCHFSFAQNLLPLKLEVSREVGNIDFTATKLKVEYWLQVDEQFVALVPEESTITTLKDDLGTDLAKLHLEAVKKREMYVEEQAKKGRYMFSSRSKELLPVSEAVALRDTTGFKFILDSWALPHSKARTIQLKGKLVYLVADSDAEEKNLTASRQALGRETEITIRGKAIKITEYGSSTIGNERSINYRMAREEVPIALSKVEAYNDSQELVSSSYGDGYSLSVKEAYINKPLTLKFYYRDLEKKEYMLDQQISLGL